MSTPRSAPAIMSRTTRPNAHANAYPVCPANNAGSDVGVTSNASKNPLESPPLTADANDDSAGDTSVSTTVPSSTKPKYSRPSSAMTDAMNGCSAFATKYTGTIVTSSETNDSTKETR